LSGPLDLLFLGSGNAFAPGRYWSSFLLNGRYLFDASPVILPHLKKCGIALEEIEAVFITHFHGDHFFGLPFLFLEYRHLTPRSKALTIIGPPGLEERVRTITSAGYGDLLDHVDYPLRFESVEDGRTGEAGGLAFLAREVEHVDDLQCFGYRVDAGGRTLAYSGDSTLCEPLVELAEGADVFVVECSCWGEACGPHVSPRDLVELRRRLGPKPTFVLTHLDAGAGDIGIENAVLADDLARFAL
jgi:ribonuclease BN (tRNA processing enzyme)